MPVLRRGLCRRVRVLRRGHGLLVGLTGTGRSTLARVAAFCAGAATEHFSGGAVEARQQLKTVLLDVGTSSADKQAMWLLTETSVAGADEALLEDVNSLVNTGNVNPAAFWVVFKMFTSGINSVLTDRKTSAATAPTAEAGATATATSTTKRWWWFHANAFHTCALGQVTERCIYYHRSACPFIRRSHVARRCWMKCEFQNSISCRDRE